MFPLQYKWIKASYFKHVEAAERLKNNDINNEAASQRRMKHSPLSIGRMPAS